MGIFKSKYEKELDVLIQSLNMDMSNNYKDNAKDDLKELVAAFETMRSEEELKGKSLEKYEGIITECVEKLKGYTHKDQKTFWH